MATKWEIGNELRFICDKIQELEKECTDDMLITEDVLETCRLAIGSLSNKLCDDGVLVAGNKDCLVEVIKITGRIEKTAR